jgi:hypothetical protein
MLTVLEENVVREPTATQYLVGVNYYMRSGSGR